jgi:hypothetical protein
VVALAAILSASAAQRSADITRGDPLWGFDIRWVDESGERQRAQFELPAELVRADLDEPLRYRKKDAARDAAAAVRELGQQYPNVDLRARVGDDGSLRISASGRSRARVKVVLAEAEAARDTAFASYNDDNGWSTLDGEIIPDHTGHASRYASALSPVVAALGGPTADPRDFSEHALGFVQSIPYERRALVRDRFRRPLSVLGRNRGDCDSKSTLYLGLLRSAYPDLPLAMVYIPDHAFVALGLTPERGDHKLRSEGSIWVIAEPTGPAMFPIGEAGGRSQRRAAWRRVRLSTVPS